jgi:hypothetical protein
MDEAGEALVSETMHLGNYDSKSDMFRDAVKVLNKKLTRKHNHG